MKKVIATAGVVGLVALAFQTAGAAVLTGTLSKTADTCPQAIGNINGDDCSYNDSYTQGSADPWVGPDRSSGFYNSSLATIPTVDWTREPTPADGKVSPIVTVNLTVGAGNLVSGTIVIGQVNFSNFSSGPNGRGEDGWTTATITLVAKNADSVSGNTLVIGSAGYPAYLQALNSSDQFPSETAADSNRDDVGPDVPWWVGPAAVGITNVEGNNGTTGTMAVGDFVGYHCNDVDGDIGTGACNTVSSFRGRANFENILLKITVDGAGNPLAVEGFLVQGGAGIPNPATAPNWVAWTFSATVDTDNDGLPDIADNCRLVANTDAGVVTGTAVLKYQLDADADGYGNLCDADLNNSGTVTTGDFSILRAQLNQSYSSSANAAKSDLNGSGTVTTGDFTILRNRLNGNPGPSGLHLNCPPTCP